MKVACEPDALSHTTTWRALRASQSEISIYGATHSLVAFFKDELAPYDVNDKGTIRFRLSEPVPVKLIERIAKFRAKQVAEPEKSKTAASES